MVASTAQFTACAHRLSPSTTAGANGSLEKISSSKITNPSGPPSEAGYADRSPFSWDRSLDQPSQRPAMNASCNKSTSSNDCTSNDSPRASNSAATLPSLVVPPATHTTAPSMSSMLV